MTLTLHSARRDSPRRVAVTNDVLAVTRTHQHDMESDGCIGTRRECEQRPEASMPALGCGLGLHRLCPPTARGRLPAAARRAHAMPCHAIPSHLMVSCRIASDRLASWPAPNGPRHPIGTQPTTGGPGFRPVMGKQPCRPHGLWAKVVDNDVATAPETCRRQPTTTR